MAPPARSAEPSVATTTVETPGAEPIRERAFNRFTARDYTYVRRELLRIAVIAIAIMVLLVVLSFFLP